MNSWTKTARALILLITFCAQAFPVAYFHHSHNPQSLPSISNHASQSPVARTSSGDQYPHHHHSFFEHVTDERQYATTEEDDHGHTFSQHIEFHWIRSISRSLLFPTGYSILVASGNLAQTRPDTSEKLTSRQTSLHESLLTGSIDPRGPPSFG